MRALHYYHRYYYCCAAAASLWCPGVRTVARRGRVRLKNNNNNNIIL
jgi:hypothetical protein